jgi:capsular exopolysaccharide synthesis family protein
MFPPPAKKTPGPDSARAGLDPSLEPANTPHLPLAYSPGIDPAALAAATAPGGTSVLQVVRRRWMLAFGLGLAAAALTIAVVWFLMPGKYSAQALVTVSPRAHGGAYESETDFQNFQRTQASWVKRPSVLRAVLARPDIAQLNEVRAQEDPLNWLGKNLTADFQDAPEVMRVSLSGDYPEDLAVILNEVVKAYLREYAAKEKAKAAARIKQLREGYQTCAEALREQRATFAQRLEAAGLEDPQAAAARHQSALQRLASAQGKELTLRLELTRLEVQLASELTQLKTPDALVITDLAIDEEFKKEAVVKKQLEALEKAEDNIQKARGLTAPSGRQAALKPYLEARQTALDALAGLKKELRPRIEKRLRAQTLASLKDNVRKLDTQIKLHREEHKALTGEVKKLEAQAENLRAAVRAQDKLPPELEALRDGIHQSESTLKRISDEIGALQVDLPGGQRVQLEQAAVPPLGRSADRKFKILGVAGVAALGVVMLGVFFLEYRTRRVYGADDVVNTVGLSLLGTLPALPTQTRRALATPKAPREQYWQSVLTESVDAIRTLLLHSAQTEPLRVVMVTSALGAEGKTSLASHLAVSLARSWRKTLLIDCDLRHPAAHQQFDLPLEPGFSEALRGEVGFEDAVRPTPVSRLWMLPAGHWDSHAIQALAQDQMHSIFERLKEQYDFIVIDACPVLPVADSLLIGQHADAVLFSILRDVSRVPAVQAAHQRLAALGIRMLGAVVIGESPPSYGPDYHYPVQAPG